MKHKVLLFNPRSATAKHRVPNSILQVAASIHGIFEYVLVDGNLEADPWTTIQGYLLDASFRYVGFTVMPGPQLRQAIPFAQKLKKQFPHLIQIWGGYFASNQYQAVMHSGWIDFVVDGPGDRAFPSLLHALEHQTPFEFIPNLIWKTQEGDVIKNSKEALLDQDSLPEMPYETLNQFYPLDKYLNPTFLGKKTLAYHSSMGCPFKCSFCAVAPIYEARWKGKSAEKIFRDIMYVRDKWGADSIEFHDNNFFVSEKRTAAFAKLMLGKNMNWWGEARIDTVDQYTDASLALMREAGCKMIFFGAETGNDELLKQMDKGGKQTGAQILAFAERLKKFDIIPEYSFVLGLPAENEQEVWRQIKSDVQFIKRIKEVNPDTEIILYVYSPVPTEGSELYTQIQKAGFRFPQHLSEWLSPQWEQFDQRKNPLTPWLTPAMIQYIQDFETVIHARFPTISDTKLTSLQRSVMPALSQWRYASNFFHRPYELKLLQKLWLCYRQPEWEGM